jgi:phage virion morphogenesis protein
MITVELSGFLQYPIAKALENGSWRSPMMAMVAGYLKSQTHERFAITKTSPLGPRWAPWAKGYRHKGSLLVKTGRLMGANATGSNAMMAWIRNDTSYAGFHQSGTSKMVARPFLGIAAHDAREIEQAAIRMLMENFQ